jgi:hypothetical protein
VAVRTAHRSSKGSREGTIRSGELDVVGTFSGPEDSAIFGRTTLGERLGDGTCTGGFENDTYGQWGTMIVLVRVTANQAD